MHISSAEGSAPNVLGAWALAISDAARDSAAAVSGLSGEGPAGLVAIAADPGMSIDELRRALGLTHPGTVRLVDRLVERGWVTRRPGTGRTVHVAPTPAGRRMCRRLATARAKAITGFLRPLTEETINDIAALVAPSLARATSSKDVLRHLCRLCERKACTRCPVAAGLQNATGGYDQEPTRGDA